MSNSSDERIYQEISKIVSHYEIYQCYECALVVMQWLTEHQISGRIIELRTRYQDEDYIISDRRGTEESITTNGKHYGVEVNGIVFDNLSIEGLILEEWLKDFHCQSTELGGR